MRHSDLDDRTRSLMNRDCERLMMRYNSSNPQKFRGIVILIMIEFACTIILVFLTGESLALVEIVGRHVLIAICPFG